MPFKKRRSVPSQHCGHRDNATSTGALGHVQHRSIIPAADTTPEVPGGFDRRAVEFLTFPEDFANFRAKYWERLPRLYAGKKAPSRTAYFRDLCNLEVFKQYVKENDEALEFGVDLNATRFVNGVKESANGQVVDAEALQVLWQKGCTLQVVQPQRWEPRLMALVAALECQLGCLVGVNAYLTPPGTQGLAPHHDAVELFVCQTSGSKTWRLYKPVNGHSLPAMPSGDLDPRNLGDPIAEVTLQVGDVLYLPKGTVHQAVATSAQPSSHNRKGSHHARKRKHASSGAYAVENGATNGVEHAQPHSAHLTLSTYNRWSHADLLATLLRVAESGSGTREASLPLRLRRGLPFDFLATHGLQASLMRPLDSSTPTSTAAALASGLRKLAADIEARPDLVDAAADDMAQDFLRMRAPPLSGTADSQLLKGGPPMQTSRVFASAPGCFRLVRCTVEEMLEAGGSPSDIHGDGFVRVVSCLHNQARNHMMAATPVDAALDARHDNHDTDKGANSNCCNGSHCKHDVALSQGDGRGSSSSSGCEGDSCHNVESEPEHEEISDSTSLAESDVDELVLPAGHAAAAAALLQTSASKPMAVASVPLPTSQERLTLTHALWDIGAVLVAN